MKITRVSELTGVQRTLEIDVTQEQLDRWQDGELIQRAMPQLSSNEREFIISGATQEEWGEAFGEEE